MSTGPSTPHDVDAAMSAARESFERRELHSPTARRALLSAAAESLEHAGDELVATAAAETALGEERLGNELGRTTGQLRLFADEVDEGSWLDAHIDVAPVDIRVMNVPVGPVVVFAASNFPLAFSVAGGDTASAFAAGCPVVVKAHPAHPRTSRIAADALHSAVAACNLSPAVFNMLTGGGDVGSALVDHPATAAVGFTGSLAAGRSLFNRAAARPVPIPVYAEMGSTNPVFVLPGAARARREEIATALSHSVTLGIGQFCTNPGLVFGVDLRPFAVDLAERLGEIDAATMLSPTIGARYQAGVEALLAVDGVELLAGSAGPGTPVCSLTTTDVFAATAELSEEVFGPSTLVVSCADPAELLRVAHDLPGQLTATIHGQLDDPDDVALARQLYDILTDKVGRIVWNGVPTGVAVTHAMQHGGPYPATTDSRSTSVGTAAMRRFLRPVSFQEAPPELLPEPLRDENPSQLLRRIGGTWGRSNLDR
ncbi:MAG: aldehyde dehydrogenase (NADP(+)) [Acidimicrobiales bacterium]